MFDEQHYYGKRYGLFKKVNLFGRDIVFTGVRGDLQNNQAKVLSLQPRHYL
jgi:hypothetical protein